MTLNPRLDDDERITCAIREFFDGYVHAFNAFDGDAIARRFTVPSVMSTNTGSRVWSTFDQIAENMRVLSEAYRQNGFLEARWELEELIVLAPVHVFAVVRWTIERRAGLPASTFRTSYTLRRDGDAWRILLCVAYEE